VVEKVDSVMFCLSKALGAPVGSMLAGTREAIEQGRLYRKRLGGGMRQAGVLAAAGLVALETSPAKLPEDHANAQLIAEAFAELPGVRVTMPQTNIVIFDVEATGRTSAEISAEFRKRGVLINGLSPVMMRAVTHFDVTRQDCQKAIEAAREILGAPVMSAAG